MFSVSGFCFESGPAVAHPGAHERTEAVQVYPMQQILRKQLLPLPAHAHPPGHQALPLRDLSEEVYPALPPAAAHQNTHWRQALQMQNPRYKKNRSVYYIRQNHIQPGEYSIVNCFTKQKACEQFLCPSLIPAGAVMQGTA